MPITSLWCPCVGGQVPLDHYNTGKCPMPPAPIGWLCGVVKAAMGDTLHCDGAMTPTRLTACPRAVLIADYEDTYLDTRSHDSMMNGTIVHEFIRANAPEGMYYPETQFPVEGHPAPMFLGVPIRGRIDLLHADMLTIEDIKTKGEYPAKKMLGKLQTEDEDTSQVNLYRLAVQQMFDVDARNLGVWVGWRASARPLPDRLDPSDARGVAAAKPAWFKVPAPVRNEAWIASVKPWGGRYTVGEIFDMYGWYRKARAGGTAHVEALAQVPMVGETMFGGKKCSLYCDPGVRDVCFAHMGRGDM